MAERLMKDSGTEWIGKIPEKWEMNRLKNILAERNEKNNPIITNNILSLGLNYGVIPYSEREIAGGNKAKDDLSAYKIARPNDIVMNSMNVISGSVGISNYFGCVSPVYYMFYPRSSEVNIKYYNMIFQSKAFQRSLLGLGNGIMMKENEEGNFNTVRMRIPLSKLNDIRLPIPSYEEQTKIADFLDKKVSEIDNAIEKTKQSIEEYKKLKQAIITEAVTKGLNPDVEMKDSGIEWVGEIPVNWYMSKLKYCLDKTMQYGANESGEEFSEKLPRYIRITDITIDNKLKDTGKLSLTEEQAKEFILKDKDLLFARSGGTVGKSFIYRKEYGRSAFAGYLIKATITKNLLPEFVYNYTLSSSYSSWKDRIFIQATIQNIGADKYMNMELPVPPINEQEGIIDYLTTENKKYDELILKKEQIITELEQYKKSLIYEYVTGKKEVA